MRLNWLRPPAERVRAMVSGGRLRGDTHTVSAAGMDSLVGPLVAQYLSMGYQPKENSQCGNGNGTGGLSGKENK